jgi:hypothetical protein
MVRKTKTRATAKARATVKPGAKAKARTTAKPRAKAPAKAPKPAPAHRAPAAPRDDAVLRRQLARLLRGEGAHLSYGDALEEFPVRWAGVKAPGVPHTAWQLLEHLRIAQWDMIAFSRDPGHVSPAFPDGYWPPTEEPPSPDAWRQSIDAFLGELDGFIRWATAPRTDLLADLHDGEGPPLIREAFLIADHNAYHLGQIVQIRRALEGEV